MLWASSSISHYLFNASRERATLEHTQKKVSYQSRVSFCHTFISLGQYKRTIKHECFRNLKKKRQNGQGCLQQVIQLSKVCDLKCITNV